MSDAFLISVGLMTITVAIAALVIVVVWKSLCLYEWMDNVDREKKYSDEEIRDTQKQVRDQETIIRDMIRERNTQYEAIKKLQTQVCELSLTKHKATPQRGRNA